jgi:hypothetical protein
MCRYKTNFQRQKTSPYFSILKFQYLYWENICYYFYVDVFLFKLKFLIQPQIWHNDDFMAC